MKNKNLFKIGEIADIFSISVQTLRHYEDIGLLHPSYIDPDTHYRYYGVEQTEVLNTIRYLRALDTPLTSIHSFLDNRNIPAMEEMLLHQKDEISQRLSLLEDMQKKIDRRLQILNDAKETIFNEVQVTHSEAIKYIWIKNRLHPTNYLDLETSILQLKKKQKQSIVFLGNVGVGLSKEHLIQQEYDIYDYVFILLNPEDNYEGETESIPSSTTLSIKFHGSHNNSLSSYQKLHQFMKDNQYKPCNFSREITLIDEGLTSDTSQFVTEIQIPVQKGTL